MIRISRRLRWGAAALFAGLIVLGLRWARQETEKRAERSRSASLDAPPRGRPSRPPVPGVDEPFSLPDPEPPPQLEALRERAFEAAREAGAAKPAEAAFREAVRAFVEHNRQFADRQAQAEGLSVEEVEALTAFGMMAQHMVRWPEVEAAMGEEVPEATRAEAEAHLHDTNARFKQEMRALVDEGGTAPERWDLIRRTESAFRARHFDITGMSPAHLETLLAGDPGRAYPGQALPPPETLAESAEPPGQPEVRPREAPPEEAAPREEEGPPEEEKPQEVDAR